MKFANLSLAAFILLMAPPASAQAFPSSSDEPQMSDAPRTKQEKDLGLRGKPRGQRELSAPGEDGYSTEEPDEDDDLGEALREASPPASRPL